MNSFQPGFVVNAFRALTRLSLQFLLIILFLLLSTTAVAAHSSLVRSEPPDGETLKESPTQVTAWFSEELDSRQSAMWVMDTQYTQVDNGDGGLDLEDLDHLTMVVSLPPLPNGKYAVRWSTVSAEDGDEDEGEFTFVVSSESMSNESSAPSTSISPIGLVAGLTGLIVVVVLLSIGLYRRRSAAGNNPESIG